MPYPMMQVGSRSPVAPALIVPGVTTAGISERFPLLGNRSLYGATKLAGELLIEEFKVMYGIRALINCCGVISGANGQGGPRIHCSLDGSAPVWQLTRLYGFWR